MQKQLDLAQERERFQREQLQAKDEQIESLQRLLGAPKPQSQAEQLQESTPEPIQTTSTPMPEPKLIIQEEQPESQKRRGLFGRVIRAVLD